MSMNRGMTIYNVVCTYNGILFSFKKKEILTYGVIWMNAEDIMLSEISQSQKRHILLDSTYMRLSTEFKFIEEWLSRLGS
jgi:hypothetical protein